MKDIVYGKDTKIKMFTGIEKLANLVVPTLGPKGKNVAIKNEFSDAVIINDGVSIAKEVELEEPLENLGASIIKEAALKTNDIAGDGTTTATVLSYEMVKNGIRQIEAGASEVKLRDGMNKALNKCVELLKNNSKVVQTNDQIREIATISSGSAKTGELIYDAINMVGKEGIITTEESKSETTKLNIVEGFKIDSGCVSPYMLGENNSFENLEKPYIFVTNRKITSVSEIMPLIEKVSQQGKSLVIFAEEIEGEALATLIVNKMRGSFNSIGVKAPSFGKNRKEILEDIAIVTGATFYDIDSPLDIKDVELENLGSAKNVKISKDSTIILRGDSKNDILENKIDEIKNKILDTSVSYEVETLRKRLARLLGGIAVIEVGARTQTELNEKKLRIEDALCATRAAIEEGIVEGGGIAYINMQKELKEYIINMDEEEKNGANIVLNALDRPLYYIAKNAGQNGDFVVEKIKNEKNGIGYDASNNTYVNVVEKGIIDPTKVCRIALESAVSISSMILTINGAICQKEARES